MQTGIQIGIYLVMALSVFAALAAVNLPNIFHAALAFIGTLLGIAGIFISLRADFLALAHILIYVGAVMTLVIFAIMLTQRLSDPNVRQHNNLSAPAFLGGLAFLTLMAKLIYTTPWPVKAAGTVPHVSVMDLGQALMTTYVFPFEVISVVLISALLGAIVIAKKDPL